MSEVTEVPTVDPTVEQVASPIALDLGTMDLEFGVPNVGYVARGPKSTEKYPDTPVLTMYAAPTEAKKAYRFELNKTAQELLGLKGAKADKGEIETIAFSFKVPGHLLLINISSNTNATKGSIRFTKSGSFSDKISHEYLTKTLDIDESKEWEFKLEKVAHAQFNVSSLKLMSVEAETEVSDDTLNIPEESTNY